jgi:exodeoxyribonuclease V beta subunit
VYSGDTDVFASQAADDWLCLLEAFDQPHRSGLVRAAATTMFFGETAETLAAEGDTLTDRIAAVIRQWADFARERGVAAVFEAAQHRRMSERVLSWADGERHMTDLAHLTQLLHEASHRDHFSLPALRDWLREQRDQRAHSGPAERNRRLDSDAAAVQIMTVWVSKGLQFPVVYLPFAFNRNIQTRDVVMFHEASPAGDVRCLDIGGEGSPTHAAAAQQGRREAAGDDVRLTYVALTRAQSQVVAWWAPSSDERNGGLSRLLRGRGPGDPVVPDHCDPRLIDDADALARLRAWSQAGGPVLERSLVASPADVDTDSAPTDLDVRHFHRRIDTAWRRTSYSGLLRASGGGPEGPPGVTSEPEVAELDDETADIPVAEPPAAVDAPRSPMADLPAGATFGSLVHAVLETADPQAADLGAELATQVRAHSVWWPVDAEPDAVADALIPMHDTPLGPLAPGLTLRDLGRRDRLRELDFEFPLAGGDRGDRAAVTLADVGRLVAEHLPHDDPLAPYAARLTTGALAAQSLTGYLTGSVDVVLRLPGDRFAVVDYKTNRLGEPDGPLTAADYTAARMAEAMLHSDYPLQALLYCVVLHRFLRWRLPGYTPQRHVAGVLYLFVRGMCGADTPVVDGHPAGVFTWQPPPALIEAVSDLLDGAPARRVG